MVVRCYMIPNDDFRQVCLWLGSPCLNEISCFDARTMGNQYSISRLMLWVVIVSGTISIVSSAPLTNPLVVFVAIAVVCAFAYFEVLSPFSLRNFVSFASTAIGISAMVAFVSLYCSYSPSVVSRESDVWEAFPDTILTVSIYVVTISLSSLTGMVVCNYRAPSHTKTSLILLNVPGVILAVWMLCMLVWQAIGL